MTIRFHEKSDAEAYGRIQTVGYLFSPDAGRTWQRSDGTQVTLPVTAETVDVIAAGGLDYGSALQAGALAVAPDGTPWLVHNEWSGGVGTNTVCTPAGNGKLAPHRPERTRGACAGTLLRAGAERRVRRRGPAGRGGDHRETFPTKLPGAIRPARSCASSPPTAARPSIMEQLSTTDPDTAHWFPHLERPLGIVPPPASPRHPLPGGLRGREPQRRAVKPGDLGAVTTLSAHGCGRATAYPQENKIVTLGDAVHVAWLDSVAEGFRVRIRTLDRGTGTDFASPDTGANNLPWSETRCRHSCRRYWATHSQASAGQCLTG